MLYRLEFAKGPPAEPGEPQSEILAITLDGSILMLPDNCLVLFCLIFSFYKVMT